MLAVLRDYTSNLVSPFTGNLSYSKALSFRNTHRNFFDPVFAGRDALDQIGFSSFFRFSAWWDFRHWHVEPHTGGCGVPVLLFFGFFSTKKNSFHHQRHTSCAGVTLFLSLAPWLWRNWQMTGELIFDNPGSQTANLAMRYNRLNGENVDILPLPGESNSEYNDSMVEMANHAIH